jgi:hypothetical protein
VWLLVGFAIVAEVPWVEEALVEAVASELEVVAVHAVAGVQ